MKTTEIPNPTMAKLSIAELRTLLETTAPHNPLHIIAKDECLRRVNGMTAVVNYAGLGIICCIALLGFVSAFI